MNDKEIEDLFRTLSAGKKGDTDVLLKGLQKIGQKYLADDEFNTIFENGQRILEEEGEAGVTMFFMLHGYNPETEKRCVMPVMFADWPPPEEIDGVEFGKRGALFGIGATFTDKFPGYMLVAIMHVSEAWMVQRDKDSPEEDKHVAPSKSPDKIEIGFVHAVSLDRRVSYRYNKLIRDEAGKFVRWEKFNESIHDPKNPSKPGEADDMLTNYIFEGYMRAKAKGRGSDAEKG